MKLTNELKERMKEDSGYLITAYSELYKRVISEMIKPFKNKKITKIMAPEMKGIIYGPVIAYKLNLPFVAILKSGRVPKKYVISKRYKDYSKKTKSLDVGKITVRKGDKILWVDDVLETGKSAKASINMIEKLGGKIVGITTVYNKLNKKDELFFKKYNFHFLVKID